MAGKITVCWTDSAATSLLLESIRSRHACGIPKYRESKREKAALFKANWCCPRVNPPLPIQISLPMLKQNSDHKSATFFSLLFNTHKPWLNERKVKLLLLSAVYLCCWPQLKIVKGRFVHLFTRAKKNLSRQNSSKKTCRSYTRPNENFQ